MGHTCYPVRIMSEWMIYGATGYSGRLIAEHAKRSGASPVLAGRNEAKVRALANELGLPWKCFSLEDGKSAAAEIRGLKLVLHCAGPFSQTSKVMVDACLAAGAHYLDISGEIPVFQAVYERHAEALARGVALVPGVGCDVVPSNYLSAALLARLPDAVSLDLTCLARTRTSRGTLNTAVEQLPSGGKVVRDGKLIAVPHAKFVREIDERGRRFKGMSIPLADLVAAHRLTRIPNVTVYLAFPGAAILLAKAAAPLSFLAALGIVQDVLKYFVSLKRDGTSAERERGGLTWFGEAKNAAGRTVRGQARIPDPYDFTALAAFAAVELGLSGRIKCGAGAPAEALGDGFFAALPGAVLRLAP